MKLLILSLSALVLLPPVPPGVIASSGPSAPTRIVDAVKSPITFTSDGCSGFREAKFFSCCFVHDFAYWAGGTWSDRRRADGRLRTCIAETSHNKPMAYVAYALVRMTVLGGHVFDFGWGRGWPKSERGLYAPITAGQQQQIDDERKRICRALTPNSRTGRYYVDEAEPRDDLRQIYPAQARQLCGADTPAAGLPPRTTSR